MGPLLAERHLHVLAGSNGFHWMTQAPDPVGVHETGEPPLIAENVGQQVVVLAGPLPVDRVIGTHHGIHTGLDGPAKVWKVSFVKHVLRHVDVDHKARLLHGVEREVLHARDDPWLGAFGCRSAHFAEQQRIFAVGLLGATPAGEGCDIDAETTPEIGAVGARLGSDRSADTLLDVDVPGRRTRDGDRETGRRTDSDAAWAVGEAEPGDADAVDAACRDGEEIRPGAHPLDDGLDHRLVAIEEPQQLLVGQHVQQCGGGFVGVLIAATDRVHGVGEGSAGRIDRVGHSLIVLPMTLPGLAGLNHCDFSDGWKPPASFHAACA